ncbi:MAG TPA: response regulator [Planctomycetota bacterium]|nr:response regulator [Planctomycetota bacterium]
MSTPARRRPIVLLVDDNPGDRQLTRIAFDEARVDAEFIEVSDGIEALVTLQGLLKTGRVPKLAIVDLNMPRMNGWELLAKLKGSAFQRMWRVAFTGSRSAIDCERALAQGADACIRKPTTLDDLGELMDQFCRFLQSTGLHPRPADAATT